MALCCFQWFKDTNLKANHNWDVCMQMDCTAVSNGSKILIWKQITTVRVLNKYTNRCFQWFKDTNLKANHNQLRAAECLQKAVSNGSKILIWKQITTMYVCTITRVCCFQWFKDTNLKANHNNFRHRTRSPTAVSNGSKILIWKQITTFQQILFGVYSLFPMVQRY